MIQVDAGKTLVPQETPNTQPICWALNPFHHLLEITIKYLKNDQQITHLKKGLRISSQSGHLSCPLAQAREVFSTRESGLKRPPGLK